MAGAAASEGAGRGEGLRVALRGCALADTLADLGRGRAGASSASSE